MILDDTNTKNKIQEKKRITQNISNIKSFDFNQREKRIHPNQKALSANLWQPISLRPKTQSRAMSPKMKELMVNFKYSKNFFDLFKNNSKNSPRSKRLLRRLISENNESTAKEKSKKELKEIKQQSKSSNWRLNNVKKTPI